MKTRLLRTSWHLIDAVKYLWHDHGDELGMILWCVALTMAFALAWIGLNWAEGWAR